jgi:hypothetical protein
VERADKGTGLFGCCSNELRRPSGRQKRNPTASKPMSITDLVWKDVQTLPLKDAALHLWRYKYEFDVLELPMSDWAPHANEPDPKRKMELVAAQTRHEHDFAHEGPTFDRLKRANPQASDEDCRDAIKAALKMWDDCNNCLDKNWADLGCAADNAVAKARRSNPGFLDETWQHAHGWLCYFYK